MAKKSLIGKTIGGFTIVREIGRGGMAAVYEAREVALDRTVALKIPSVELVENPAFPNLIERFKNEARAAAKVAHPNICPIYSMGEDQGVHYFAMEYVQGVDLAQYTRERGRLEPEEALSVVSQVASALAAAHDVGLLHRDIKPANIMLVVPGDFSGETQALPSGANDENSAPDDGTIERVCLMDFGLAKWEASELGLTVAGAFLGTLKYASPEQCEGEELDSRSDLYSLGAVLYEALTGCLPYEADTPGTMVNQILNTTPCRVRELQPDIDSQVEEIVDRLLAKKPEERFATARELTRAIDNATSTDFRVTSEEGAGGPQEGVLTLLFTDLVGSTAIKSDLGETAGHVLIEEHCRVTRELLGEFAEGWEISRAGDSFFIAFSRPSEAVRFSLMLHNRLRQMSKEAPKPMSVRIGVHMGEARIERKENGSVKDILGMQVDVAARVMSLAQGGQSLLSRGVFDNARQALRGKEIREIGPLSWMAHGPYLLKGVDAPAEICEVGVEGAAPLEAPPDSEKARRAVAAGDEVTLGWRPAAGLEIPLRPDWVLERQLGKGGFGEVWLARHQRMREIRAFKFCFAADRLRTLKRELTLFRLMKETLGDRPDIARLFDVQLEEAPFFLEMDYTAGGDMTDWSRRQGGIGELSLESRLDLVAQIAEALTAAHSVGVIHKDIKPTNILIDEKKDGSFQARLTDFGIGQLLSREALEEAGVTATGFTEHGETALTDLGSRTGTRLYMAPELIASRSASIQSDIYSLGVLLYQVVAGDLRRPLGQGWQRDIEDEFLREDIRCCVDGDPSLRFLSASVLAHRLRGIEQRRQERDARLKAERQAREAEWRAKQEAEQDRIQAERNRRRKKTVVVSFSVTFFLIGVLCILAIRENRRAGRLRQVLSLSDYIQGSAKIEQEDLREGLAYLARALRNDPDNYAAAARISDCLMRWTWPSPLTKPLRHDAWVQSVEFSPDGMFIVTASSDKTARIWDAKTGKPLTEPLRHEDILRSAEFSPDSLLVATASDDGTARIWDAKTGKPLTEPLRHEGAVYITRFSPDGLLVVTASRDKTARIWDAKTGKPLTKPLRHEDFVKSAEFSPDGLRVVTASWDKTARIWDAKTGKPLTEPLRHEDTVVSAEFSRNGLRVLTASLDKTARIWDGETGKLLTERLHHEAALNSARFSPDGLRVVTASVDKTARIWSAETGKPLTEPLRHEGDVSSARFSPDGKRVVTASHDKTAQVWDAKTGKPLTVALHHESHVTSARFSPDGRLVITAPFDKIARIWDIKTGCQLTQSLRHEDIVRSAKFSSDGLLVVTASDDDTARVWDAKTGKPLTGPLRHKDTVVSAEFSPDGKRVVTASNDKTAQIWDAETGKPLAEPLRHEGAVCSAGFSLDGMLVVTASNDNTARVWDAKTGKPLTDPLRHENIVVSAEFGPKGKRVVTASSDKTARAWDAKTGLPLAEPFRHENKVLSARFSSDGLLVVTTSDESATARIWEIGAGKLLTERLRHESNVVSAEFSRNDLRALTASLDKTARIWDGVTGKLLTERLHHEAALNSARFSPDGLRVVTASADKTARIWSAETGKPLTELLRHENPVLSAEFSPDGLRIVTISSDNTARTWDVAPGHNIPFPDWLRGLAEAVAGFRINEEGIFEAVSPDELSALRLRFGNATQEDPYTVLARWFFSDPAKRTVSPWSGLTVPQ